MLINDSRPLMSLIIEGKQFKRLVDTGADVSVISLQQWPNDWKKEKIPLVLTGLGSIADVWRSAQPLSCQLSNGKKVSISFYIVWSLFFRKRLMCNFHQHSGCCTKMQI